MIRVIRPERAPDVLLGAGESETRLNCDRYKQDREPYLSGAATFEFKRSIYAHATVKKTLLQAQHEKCCYCESKFRATSPGAVEHFRPKGAVKRSSSKGKLYPGYYWLAYSWNNLLVSCEICNSSYKGSLFPLADKKTRARSHYDDVEAEIPLFIDPAAEDPGQHIRFRGAAVEPLTKRGERTIEGLGLRRVELEECRAEVLDPLKILYSVIKDLKGKVQPSNIEHAGRLLDKATCSEAEFSGMVRHFVSAQARRGAGS